MYDEDLSLAELYGIIVSDYSDISVAALPFSFRVTNRLMSNGITTAALLLEMTPTKLAEIRGFGKNCLEEVKTYWAQIGRENSTICDTHLVNSRRIANFRKYAERIAYGDFSFVMEEQLSDDEYAYVDGMKEAYDLLGEELVTSCITTPDLIIPMKAMFSDFYENSKLYHELRELLWFIPRHRRNRKAIWYIKAFTLNEVERKKLLLYCNSKITTIQELVNAIPANDAQVFLLTKRFLRWCTFNLSQEIQQLLDNLYVNERARSIIGLRAAGRTLEEVGNILGVTRERIRQIEVKVKHNFARLHSRVRIVSKIAAERNGDVTLSSEEISCYCGDASSEILYLLKSYEGTNYTYDKQLDMFIVGDDSLHERVGSFLETLPDVVDVDQFAKLSSLAEEDESIPREIFEKAFLESYRKTGLVYHRSRLSLAAICEDMLLKHFPDGMYVYDAVDIAAFRQLAKSDYGDIRLPENDRALAARVSAAGVLCGRGKYRAKRKQYLPKKLLSKIYEYIVNNDLPVFLTRSIFSIFEEELIAAGVDNRYYLQGILHEIYGDKFVFRRDYISKDANFTSIYTSIVDFIKRSKYPVSKRQIYLEFPGITDVVIALAVSDKEILNYFGEYLHASNLSVSDSERQYLYNVVNEVVSDHEPHHVKDIYEIVDAEKPEILTRNAILYPFGAYSLIEYLFRAHFQFLRPYIAHIGVEIGRAGERLKELIYSSDRITIAEIRDFSKENRLQITSIIDYINACNDEYLLIDKDTLMRIDEIGITEEIAKQIERVVAMAINQTTPIYQLSIWGDLPTLSIPWTDWLLYSVLNKWATKVSVGTSSNQMKMAVPLVALAGELNNTELGDTAMGDNAVAIKFDDLDNIDELLEDIIGDDIWEDPYEL